MSYRMQVVYENSVQGAVILLSMFVALLIFQIAAASVTITSKGCWQSFEPGFYRGWTVAFKNPFDGLCRNEHRI